MQLRAACAMPYWLCHVDLVPSLATAQEEARSAELRAAAQAARVEEVQAALQAKTCAERGWSKKRRGTGLVCERPCMRKMHMHS